MTSKRRAASTVLMRQVRPLLDYRCGGCCERCGRTLPLDDLGRPQYEAHHRQLRSRGGDDSASNLAVLCAPCHRWAHCGSGAVRAAVEGWLVPSGSDPAECPIRMPAGWVLLLPDGSSSWHDERI